MQQRFFLLQILLLAQHISGTTMPIIRSSRVLYSGCCLWYLVPWFSSCWSGVELRVMCPVCRMLQHPENRTHKLSHLSLVCSAESCTLCRSVNCCHILGRNALYLVLPVGNWKWLERHLQLSDSPVRWYARFPIPCRSHLHESTPSQLSDHLPTAQEPAVRTNRMTP